MPPTLYYAPGACSLAVHVVLQWIGAPYEAVAVDQHAPAFRRINPAGAVPALDLGEGPPLTQASAILHHLGRLHPEQELLGSTGDEPELDRWADFLTGDLHPAFFPVFTPQRYTTDAQPAALNAVRAAGLALVAGKLALLEDHMRGREWVVGDSRTLVDAYAIPMLNWARAKLDGGLTRFPALDAFLNRMLADPAVVEVTRIEREAVPRR